MLRGVVEAQRRIAPPLAHAGPVLLVPDKLAPATRSRGTFASTSWSMALFRLRLATSLFSYAISSSSC